MSPNEKRSKYYDIFLQNITSYGVMLNLVQELFDSKLDKKEKSQKQINFNFLRDILEKNVQNKRYISFLKAKYETFKKYSNQNEFLFIYAEFENYFYKIYDFFLSKWAVTELDKAQIIKELLTDRKKKNLDVNVQKLIDDFVENRLRSSFNKFFKNTKEILKIKFNIPDYNIKELNKFRDIRNLYTHVGGIVNGKFLKSDKGSKFKLGEKRIISNDDVSDFYILVINILNEFDLAIVEKYDEIIKNNIYEFSLVPNTEGVFS